MNIFEKLKSGDPVNMMSEEYLPVIAELHRADKAEMENETMYKYDFTLKTITFDFCLRQLHRNSFKGHHFSISDKGRILPWKIGSDQRKVVGDYPAASYQ